MVHHSRLGASRATVDDSLPLSACLEGNEHGIEGETMDGSVDGGNEYCDGSAGMLAGSDGENN